MNLFTKLTMIVLSIGFLMSFTNITTSTDKHDPEKELAPFPKAAKGMVRYVIMLDKKSDESNYKVEIIPGKVMSVDCNHHMLSGTLKTKNLQGWGYTYYEFQSNGQAASTLMACNKPNTDKFVTGETLLIRYNSKLPIVIYAPKGFEVKYKIWKAGKEKSTQEK